MSTIEFESTLSIASHPPKLAVCVATRNRPDDLIRCLNSLTLLNHLPFEVIVIDDASEAPILTQLLEQVNPDILPAVKFFQHETNHGATPTKNELAERASAPYLLCLDDDARIANAESIDLALQVLETDPQVGAIALSQCDEQGTLLPGQPTEIGYNCYTPAFIGYGTVLRRDLFLELGGYRTSFSITYEESELCKRMLDRGFYVVYLPQARVIHSHSPIERNELTKLRNGCRNKCFSAIYSEPLPMLLLTIPLRILVYAYTHWKFCRERNLTDVHGAKWVISEVRQMLPTLWRDRKVLKWRTYYKWHQIKTQKTAYSVIN
jgi:GT2 family glycosyltransferase